MHRPIILKTFDAYRGSFDLNVDVDNGVSKKHTISVFPLSLKILTFFSDYARSNGHFI